MTDGRVFKATEIDSHAKGWIADLSPAGIASPDYYWRWNTKKQAEHFVALIDSGMDANTARHEVETVAATAAALGSRGGSVTSDAKSNAARENGRKGGRPRKP